MEWLIYVSPIIAIGGLIVIAAVGYYRIGQNEKKIDQNKEEQERRCAICRASQRDAQSSQETKTASWQAMMQELMKMHTAQVLANNTEHAGMNISAARTEEQLKSLVSKIEDLASAIHRIERNMPPREYFPSRDESSARFERKG